MQYPPHPFTYSICYLEADIIVFNKTSVSRNTRTFWKRTDIVRLHQYLHSYRICINFYPAHTLPEPPLHRTRTLGIQKLPLTQPRKLRQQKPPQPHNSPLPHNSYQLCSRPLQNTYEKVYSLTLLPPSLPGTEPEIPHNPAQKRHKPIRHNQIKKIPALRQSPVNQIKRQIPLEGCHASCPLTESTSIRH